METTGDVRASSFLFERISVAMERFNSVLLHDCFVDDERPLPNSLYSSSSVLDSPGFFPQLKTFICNK